MNEIETLVSILVLGIALGLVVAHLESRIDEDLWKHVRRICGVAGAIFIVFFVCFGYMVWYCIGLAFFSVVLYERHKRNKYSGHNGFQHRRRGVLPRFGNPYSRREERPQLEEWL